MKWLHDCHVCLFTAGLNMIPFCMYKYIYKYLYIVVISNFFVSTALIKDGVILIKGETCLGRQ